MSKWEKIDHLRLLMKHGKIGINDKESAISDKMIDKIAETIQDQPGSYNIPEENKTKLSQQSFPTAKTQLINPDAASDAEEMIRQYTLQNGSIIVPDGQSVEDFKRQLESDDNTPDESSGLICG